MAIRADETGFLIGEKRLKQMADSIDQTKDNTYEILQAMVGTVKEAIDSERKDITEAVKEVKEAYQEGNKAAQKQGNRTLPSSTAPKRIIDTDLPKSDYKRARDASEAVNPNSAEYRAQKQRERDKSGRFVSAAGSNDKNLLFKIKEAINVRGGDGDVRGYDPTIDALTELKDIVSPVGSIFSQMTGKAANLFNGRARKKRNDEVLPEEQAEYYRNEEKSDKERNNLLRRLIDAVRGIKGSSSNGIDATDLIGLGKGKNIAKLGKGILKRFPLIAALVGGGMLAKDWDGLDSGGKGKGIGEIAGGIAGAAAGSLFGPAGTLLGGGFGAYLGGIFGKKVGEWTDELKDIDFSKLFTDFLKSVAGGTASLVTHPVQTVGGWGRSLYDKGMQGLYDMSGGAVGSDVNSPIGKNKTEKQLAVYNAMKKAGFNSNWAAAMTASIGRENDYRDEYLFGKHQDKAGGINQGLISWQGARRDRLNAFMKQRGLVDNNGNFKKGQASLDAQAEYTKWELENDPAFAPVREYMKNNPNASKEDAARVLGKKYVKWAYGQSILRNGQSFDWKPHLAKEYNYRNNLDKAIQQNGDDVPSAVKPGVRTDVQVPYAIKPKTVSAINTKTTSDRPKPIRVPTIKDLKTESSKAGMKSPVVINKQDASITQNVSDRGLAHVLGGGIGYKSQN
ncbi:phage tail tip lysozyme [Acinetobacter nosocomialis]|uniref:phage tail tip lysozyme n=1 Tax=Acinetobacter nosocomialis TaxID=106654 RepID=UPI0024472F6D|nr:phage tail tip lysozyme [Acinetobacter nosocomialis]MDH2636817.1 phage tail tip lysozyme [Acinetobacter nosocomialis]